MPSIFSRSSEEQVTALRTMDQVAGGVRGGQVLNRELGATQERIREISDQAANLSKIVSEAFRRTKTTMEASLGDSQKVDFPSLPVSANLTDTYFGSEKSAFKAALAKMTKVASQIPHLDLTYFSADYSFHTTEATIREFVDSVNVLDDGKEKISFAQVQEAIRNFSVPLMDATKAIVTLGPKGELGKALQTKATEMKTFERDRLILNKMIHLKTTHFKDKDQLKELISILSKEADDALFREVFTNLFARATADEFLTLFKHFHQFIFAGELAEGNETNNTNAFLYYLQENIALVDVSEDPSLVVQRREVLTDHFLEIAKKYEDDPAVLSWNIQFVVNNPEFFKSDLGGATRAPEIFKEMIQTALFGPEVDFTKMQRADYKQLLAQRVADAPARLSFVITREIYAIEAFRAVYDMLAKTNSTLRAAQELTWAKSGSSPELGYASGSTRSPASRLSSTSSLEEEDGFTDEEDWSEGEEDEEVTGGKPAVAPKPDLRSRVPVDDLNAALLARRTRTASESA